MGSSVLASLLSLSTELSVLARKKKKERGRSRRMREEAKYKNKLAQRDKVRYQKSGWWGMNEIEFQTCCGLWGQGVYHSASETTTTTRSIGEPTNLGYGIVHYLLKEKNPAWSLALSLFYTQTHTQSLLTVHIWRERMERVPYCPLSGDVGVCVRAWLLLVYIRVLNSSIALSIWARQIYLCCGSFMHLLFPKRIGMHSGREDR